MTEDDNNVVHAEIRYINATLGRLEKGQENLVTMFDRSSTKQGERLGVVEDDVIRLRADLKWMLTVAAGIWAVLQAAVLALAEWHK